MKEAKITISDLAKEVGVSVQMINNYRAETNIPRIDTAYAICFALEFPYSVSMALLGTLGYTVTMNERGQIIDFCLQSGYTVQQCNELLGDKGIEPITK